MKTSLSAGAIIRDILLADADVRRLTNKVFPVVTDKAELPCILYRRAALQHNPTKAGQPGADTVTMDVFCYTAGYADGVELAEAVRKVLDCAQREKDGLSMRSCTLVDSEEDFDGDAFVQRLTFAVRM